MTYSSFARQVEVAGLIPVNHGRGHWQIKGGPLLVNYYPATGTIYVNGTTGGRRGKLEDAIAAAKTPPPVTEDRDSRKNRKWNRRRLFRLYKKSSICHWCGKSVSPQEASLDHVIPLSRGGLTNMNNLVLAHKKCNHGRGNEMPEIQNAQQLHSGQESGRVGQDNLSNVQVIESEKGPSDAERVSVSDDSNPLDAG